MAIRTGIILCTLLLGCLAVPVPEADLSIFFPETREGSTRIVGGAVAPQGSHPWMVAMSSGNLFRSFMCGGSVLTSRTVLTAAHCVAAAILGNNLVSTLRVTVGTNTWSSGGQTLALSGFSNHPQYDRNTIKYDIGVLYTSTAIAFGNNVQALPVSYEHAGGGIPARVAGWGAIRANGAAQAQLLQIQLPTIEGNQCISGVAQASIDFNVRAPHVDPTIEICTFHSAGSGTCQGDSGSALVRIDRGQQIGIVSWGFPCARGAPDMFVRVSAFQSWIQQNTV